MLSSSEPASLPAAVSRPTFPETGHYSTHNPLPEPRLLLGRSEAPWNPGSRSPERETEREGDVP